MLFGPVWSRRFGWSLGVNQFPEKVCTYACPYCQLGPGKVTLERMRLCSPKELLEELREINAHYDVVTFVPKGEPLLDLNIWKCADLVKILTGKPTVLLSNGSLLFDPEIRLNASRFDIVSIKVDAGDEEVWRRINAPHQDLKFDDVISGIITFAKTFDNTLVTETMLVRGFNDSKDHLREVAYILEELNPKVAFVLVPTRPPTVSVEPGDVETAMKVFGEVLGDRVIVITDRSFDSYPRDEENLKEVARVHPVPKRFFEEVPDECSVVEFNGEEFVRC